MIKNNKKETFLFFLIIVILLQMNPNILNVDAAPSAPILSYPTNGSVDNDLTPQLGWNSVSGAAEYRIQVDDSSGFTSTAVDIIQSSSFCYYVCPTLSNDVYYWRVCAKDYSEDWGSWSSVWAFEIDTISPSAPDLVSPSHFSTTTDSTPYLDWDSVSDAVVYQVQVDDSSSFTSTAVDIYATNTYYTTPSLSDDVYYWRVCARDAASNWGSWSSVWTFEIDTTGPNPPSLVSPTDGSRSNDDTPYFDWSSVGGAVEYRLQVSTYFDFSWLALDTYTSNTYFTQPTAVDDDVYYWRVCARDDVGNWGSWSSIWDFVIDTIPPGAPSLVSPTDGALTNDNTPYLDWDSVSDAVEYQVQVDDSSGFTSPAVDYLTSSTSHTTPSLSDDVYYWRVCARDAAGNWGSWSSYRTFTVDTIAPSISSINHSPANPSDADFVTCSATVTDNVAVQSVTLYYRIDGGTLQTVDMTASGSTYSATIGPFATDSSTEYYIIAIDSSDNSVESSHSLITIVDGSPDISNIQHTPSSPSDQDSITISCTVTDDLGVQSVTLYYRIDGGTLQTVDMTASGSTYSATIGPFAAGSSVEYYIIAIDSSTNNTESSHSFITIVDGSPDISNIQHTPSSPSDQDSITISCTVTDDVGVQSVTLYYRIDGGTLQTVDMTASGSTYSATIGPFAADGSVEYYIIAIDSSTNNTESSHSTIYIQPSIDYPPVISDIIFNPSEPSGSDTITISATVTDDDAIQAVILYYSVDGGETWKNVVMSAEGTTYSIAVGPFTSGAEIQFYVHAIDSSGNPSDSIIFSVSIQPPEIDITVSPSDYIIVESGITSSVDVIFTINGGTGSGECSIYLNGPQITSLSYTGNVIMYSFDASVFDVYKTYDLILTIVDNSGVVETCTVKVFFVSRIFGVMGTTSVITNTSSQFTLSYEITNELQADDVEITFRIRWDDLIRIESISGVGVYVSIDNSKNEAFITLVFTSSLRTITLTATISTLDEEGLANIYIGDFNSKVNQCNINSKDTMILEAQYEPFTIKIEISKTKESTASVSMTLLLIPLALLCIAIIIRLRPISKKSREKNWNK